MVSVVSQRLFRRFDRPSLARRGWTRESVLRNDLLFVLFLSVGEALWNPRLYEYTAAVAPKGQEASYMSLSFLPYFIAKFFVGMFSGNLLNHYCPATGARHSETMWLIIALMTLTTPVGLLLFGRFIRVHEAGRKDEA
jgi:hypothetical protein